MHRTPDRVHCYTTARGALKEAGRRREGGWDGLKMEYVKYARKESSKNLSYDLHSIVKS